MRILACQITVPPVADAALRDANMRAVAARISERLTRDACDLVVLPELCTIPYSLAAFDALSDLAEDLEGPSVALFSALARDHGCCVAIGLPRKSGGRVHISQVVIGADGRIIGTYDKLHIASFGASLEKAYFTPGDNLLVFDCAGVRCGVVVCYDFRFPELLRHLAVDLEVDLILHPVAFARDATFASWRSFVVCRALENQVYMLSLNRAGPEFGFSVFCPPWIDDATRPDIAGTGEEMRVFTVELDEIARVRATYPFRGDRFGDYRALRVLGRP